jgi:hypothetical protein
LIVGKGTNPLFHVLGRGNEHLLLAVTLVQRGIRFHADPFRNFF